MGNRTERRAMLLGAVIGALSGAGLGLLFVRSRASRPAGERRPVHVGQVFRLGSAIMTAVRQFMEVIA